MATQTLAVLLHCVSICLSISETELIWYDSLDNFTSHWITSGGPTQVVDDISNKYCTTSPNCVKINAYIDAEDWIIRTTVLQLIPNLNIFDSFLIQFDVILSNMERHNYCRIKYKYDIDNDYKIVKSYAGLGSTATIPIKHINESEFIQMPVVENNNNTVRAKLLYILLEAEGDSSSGNDICYFDNIYLYGNTFDDSDVIWYDNMDNIWDTNWIEADNANNESITQMISDSQYCVTDGCVELSGWETFDNSIYNFVSNISNYHDLIVEFDAYLRNMEYHNGCQLFYKYDTDPIDDWYLLYSIVGGNGDQFYKHEIITIFENPSYKNSTVLYLKLKNNGDSSSGGDYCYFDNLYVRGNIGERGNYFDNHNGDFNFNKGHIIIMGDMGGQEDPPYYTPEQVSTADMLSTIAKQYDISGIIELGDNMYSSGVYNEFDPRFNWTFEEVYYHTNIKDINWYLTSGNHDYGNGHGYAGNITGEIEYSKHSERWNFPSNYYTQSWYFGENQEIELLFVALDTYILCGLVSGSEGNCTAPDPEKARQHWDWLNHTLAARVNATFKLVGGHTPIFSYASHGPTGGLINYLNPLLEMYGVNAYIFGHDHVLQFIEDNTSTTNVHHIGSGAAHGCRDAFDNINSEKNPSINALKYMDCNQGGFVRLTIDTMKRTMQAFYYLSDTPNIQFFTGIWDEYGNYKTINDILYGETMQPTLDPTKYPTIQPTVEPTIEPTISPTIEPTLEPTLDPTNSPSKFPTIDPTNSPSKSPTVISDNSSDKNKKGGSLNYILLGIVAVILIFIALACLFIIYKKRKARKDGKDDVYQSLLDNKQMNQNENNRPRGGSYIQMESNMRVNN